MIAYYDDIQHLSPDQLSGFFVGRMRWNRTRKIPPYSPSPDEMRCS